MDSMLPYLNKIEYMIQTKLQTEISNDLKNDIEYALYDYAKKCVEVSENEKEYWKRLYLKGKK